MRLRPPTAYKVGRDELPSLVARLVREGWRLALTAAHEETTDAFRVVYVFLRPVGERVEVTVTFAKDDAWLPSLAAISYPAGRFEREIHDLYGIRPDGHPLPHRMVRHAHWPSGYHPMLRGAEVSPMFDAGAQSYPFLQVEGDGVYEIPVGPIHAGLIEPGHFRFSVVGETILRMKARLWFLHRGVEKLFEGRTVADGIALAERISGDTAVGHSLAYVMAVEDALGISVSSQVLAARALLLEYERLYNHISDLGAIVNDVAYGIAHSHTQRLRESLLRHNRELTGHRLLRGALTIGDTRLLAAPDLDLVASVAAETAEIVAIALDHSVIANRLTGTAVLHRAQVEHMDSLGYVARASGVPTDARRDHPFVDLGPSYHLVTEETGDVRARFLVRAREVAVSAEVIRNLAGRLGAGTTGAAQAVYAAPPGEPVAGFAVVEAWRGTLCHRVEVAADGTLGRVKVVDPSWFTWPALPQALTDTIVPDFPLANKSFNLSYAGNDL